MYLRRLPTGGWQDLADVHDAHCHKYSSHLCVTLVHHPPVNVTLPVPARQSTALTIVKPDPSWENTRAHSTMSTPQPASSTAAATERMISVAKYHARQGEKRGVDTGTCKPTHVLEGSCVVSGDGSNDMRLDCESDAPDEGEAEEEEKALPSQHKDSQSLVEEDGRSTVRIAAFA
ncbi:unnamed protein product [Phytophthora lilii]|uniref:Unnamed protein product n=1 Tax=Phytophthora lilii TaxID=2077276 RepID=A0A9W7CKY3_9STRA|nr:unnamed protein product [Phytophthora lilii]